MSDVISLKCLLLHMRFPVSRLKKLPGVRRNGSVARSLHYFCRRSELSSHHPYWWLKSTPHFSSKVPALVYCNKTLTKTILGSKGFILLLFIFHFRGYSPPPRKSNQELTQRWHNLQFKGPPHINHSLGCGHEVI